MIRKREPDFGISIVKFCSYDVCRRLDFLQLIGQIERDDPVERLSHFRRKRPVVRRAEALHERLASPVRQIAEQMRPFGEIHRAAQRAVELLLRRPLPAVGLFDAGAAGDDHAAHQLRVRRRQQDRHPAAEGMGDDVARGEIEAAEGSGGGRAVPFLPCPGKSSAATCMLPSSAC